MIDENWFRTDYLNELKDAVSFSDMQITTYLEEKSHIKWPIITTANVLQCACVLHLRGNSTNSLPILTTKIRKQWLEVHYSDDDKKPPSLRLEYPQELYKKSIKRNNVPYHIKWLFEMRNSFIHFVNGSHSIELSGFESVLKLCWKDILEILNKPREYEFRYPSKDINYINSVTKNIIKALDK